MTDSDRKNNFPHPPDSSARHPDSSARHPDSAARHPDSAARHPDSSARHPDSSARHPDSSARHPDSSARHPDSAARHSERSEESRTAPNRKKGWRQRWGVSRVIAFAVIGATLITCLMAGWYGLKILHENKVHDTWSIIFLELERRGYLISDKLNHHDLKASDSGVSILKVQGNSVVPLSGPFPGSIALKKSGLNDADFKQALVFSHAGVPYLAKPWSAHRNHFLVREIQISDFLVGISANLGDTVVYVVNKTGQMVYSSSDYITAAGFVERPVVQEFISAPLRQGQLEFKAADGDRYYGFFYEIPKSNLVIFAETPASVVTSVIYDIAVKFLLILGVVLTIVLLFLQFPINAITTPLREVVRAAGEVSMGNFNVSLYKQSFGEINVLSRSVQLMADNLEERDRAIDRLMSDRLEKTRLEGELRIAKGIQENLLPQTIIGKETGLEIAATYVPAAEVAGDWYGCAYNPVLNESVVAIADVSGHGAGSAMFTAMIAGLFEDMTADHKCSFDLAQFAIKLNRLFVRLGKGKAHATMQVIKFRPDDEAVEFLNAGHPFAQFVKYDSEKSPNKIIDGGSNVLGIEEHYKPLIKQVAFPENSCLLLVTDGVLEATNPKGRQYGLKRLTKVAKIGEYATVEEMLNRVQLDWQQYTNGQPAMDDVCMVGIKRVA